MLARMCAPALATMALAMVVAVVVSTISEFPAVLGGQPVWPGLGNTIALTGLGVSLTIYAAQLIRYRRWTEGKSDCCYVCTCLLGREREGRYGPYRKCLGCGKNHALGRI
jgi:hypothetical protein